MKFEVLNGEGLTYFWGKIKAAFVAKETGKGLSTNDYTTAEKTKLEGLSKITVDTALSATSTNPVQNKAVKVALDGKLSDADLVAITNAEIDAIVES